MYDYHTHSSFSDDSTTPMQEMIETACKVGIKEIAVTDHYDPDYPENEYPNELNFYGYHKCLDEMKETYKNRIKVVKGIEVGIQDGSTLKKCTTCTKEYDYDFVIGSFHCAEGHDLYTRIFYQNRSAEDAYISYYTMVRDILKKYSDFDVLGHFNIIDRYTDHIAEASVYIDIADEILKIIIENGKGIEINNSSYRYGMGERTTPTQDILNRYKALGGEIITIGSDSHRPKDLGSYFYRAVDMMKAAGFRYLTTFDQRKPTFINLESL